MCPDSPTAKSSLVDEVAALLRTPMPMTVLRRGRCVAGVVAFAGAFALFNLADDTAQAATSKTSAPVDAVANITIEKGDTLSSIAARNAVSVSALVAVNGIKDEHKIIAGERLLVPTQSASGRETKVTRAKTTSGKPSFTGPAPKSSAGQPLPRGLRAHPERVALDKTFDSAARTHGVPAELLKAMAWQESGWQNKVTSNVGAQGIGQLMPDTVKFVNSDLSKTRLDPAKPEQNIKISAIYLRYLLDQTGGDSRLALASYYQGLNAVRTKGVYNDTQTYVRNVVYLQNNYF